jgi:hypothetical protein
MLNSLSSSRRSMNLTMNEAIKVQESLQREELAWVSNLYMKRLKDLQETEVKRQEWLKTQEGKDSELA